MKKIPFLILFAVLALTSLAENATFNIATYNIRQANHSDSVAGNGWGRREPHVASLISSTFSVPRKDSVSSLTSSEKTSRATLISA